MAERWTEKDERGRVWRVMLDPEHEEDDCEDFSRAYPAFGLYLTPTRADQNIVPATTPPARPAEMRQPNVAVSDGGARP